MLRVMAKQARAEMQGFRGEVRQLEAALGAGRGAVNGLISTEALTRLSKWGSQLQWAGRQLMYNFTLPVIGAGAMITKWSLANEEAMVRVKKVYGDASDDVDKFARDSEKLGTVFDLLSEKYAVNREEVVRVAADWAAAGATGASLAKSVETTLKTMVLGEMDAVKSTEALIAIQAQYGLNTEGLIETINILNATENATGTTFQGLVEGMSRSAGVARSAGIDTRHLVAMIAALTPASGTATQAGNGLKTMISRILSPTKDAADILGLMGMNVQELDWKSKNGTERLETLAIAFSKLEGAGEGVVSSQAAIVSQYMASRYQINRFDVLMRDILASIDDNVETNGYYGKSLSATASEAKIAEVAMRELDAVLTSQPAGFKRAAVVIQNSLMKAFQPLLPHILSVVESIAELLRKFGELDPRIQKTIFYIAAFAAALGPPLALIGAVGVGVGQLGLLITTGLNAWKKITGFLFGFGAATKAAKTASLNVAAGTAGPLTLAKGYDTLTASATLAARATATASAVTGAAALPIPGKKTKAPKVAGGLKAEIDNGHKYMLGLGFAVREGLKSALTTVQAGVLAIATASTSLFAGMSRAASVGSAKIAAAGRAAGASSKATAAAVASGWRAASVAAAGGAARIGAVAGPPLAKLNYDVHRTMTQSVPIAFKAGMDRASLAVAQGSLTVNRVMSRSLMENMRVANAHAVGVGATFSRMWGQVSAATVAGTQATIGAVRNMATTNTATIAAAARAQTAATIAGARAQAAAVLAGARVQTAAIAASARTQGAVAAAGVAVGMRSAGRTISGGIGAILLRIKSLGPALGRALVGVGRFMTGWVGLVITAVIALIAMFREQIGQIFSNVGKMLRDGSSGFSKAWQGTVNIFNQGVNWVHKAFNRLPAGIRNALKAVVDMVASAAKAVYRFFSYMNPFQRHSPSLVENVTNGMRVVAEQFGIGVTAIKNHMLDGYSALKRFGTAVAGFMRQYENLQKQEDRSSIKTAFGAGAVASYDMLSAKIPPLRADLERLNNAIDLQTLKVGNLSIALEKQKVKYDQAQAALRRYENVVSDLESSLDSARTKLDQFTSAGIIGQRKMSDAMFENEMAQKRLRLAILKLNETGTGDLEGRLASLRGEIETLQGEKADLRQAGAGGDILSGYDDMIANLEAQQGTILDSADEYNKLQEQLKELERAGEMLDLENSIQFDPLLRQIEQLTDGYREIPFEEILAGVKKQQAEIAILEEKLKGANKAVEDQEKVVDQAQAALDRAQASYDAATAGLNSMQEAARMLTDEISELEQALSRLVAAADAINEANEAAKRAAEAKKGAGGKDGYGADAFKGAAGGGFDDPGAFNTIGDEGGSLDDYIKGLMGTMSQVDIFGPIKEGWNRLKGWWSSNVTPIWNGLVEGMGEVFSGIDWLKPLRRVGDWFKNNKVVNAVVDWGKRIWENLKGVYDNAADGVKRAWDKISPALDRAKEQFSKIGDHFRKIGDMIKDVWEGKVGDGIRVVWGFLKQMAAWIGGVFLAGWLVLTDILENTVGPAFELVGDVIAFAIDFISGVLTAFFQFITGDWEGMFETIKETAIQLWDDIKAIFESWKDVVVGIFTGIVEGIVGAWDWLYDVLVGNSIIPDLVEAIFDWFAKLPEKLWQFVKDAVEKVVEWFGNMFTWIWEKLVDAGTWLWDKGGEIIDGLWGGIKDVWTSVADWFSNLGGSILDFVKDAGKWLWDTGKAILTGLWDGIKEIWENVDEWFVGLGGLVLGAIGGAGKWLWDTGKDILTGLWDGTKEVWKNVTGWFGGLKDGALKALGKTKDWLLEKGEQALDGLWNGAKSIWTNTTNWLGGLKDKAFKAVGDAKDWLTRKGKDALDSLWSGAKSIWTNTTNWLGGLKDGAFKAVGDAKNWLTQKGKDALDSFWSGAKGAWGNVTGWLGDMKDGAFKAVGDAKDWLTSKGKDAIDSVKNGAESAWKSTSQWMGDMERKAATAVGDAKNWLTSKGSDAINGFSKGMESSWTTVKGWFGSKPKADMSSAMNIAETMVTAGKTTMNGYERGLKGEWTGKVDPYLKGRGTAANSATGSTLNTLVQKGRDLMTGLSNGQNTGWTTASNWLKGLGTRVNGAVPGLSATLKPKGEQVTNGLNSGVTGRWGTVNTWLKGLNSRVTSAATGGTGTLYNNGLNLIVGLYNGVVKQWRVVQNLVKSMAGWIKNNKGPIEKDRTLLVDEGRAIMEGLENGIRSKMGSLEGTLGDVTALMAGEVGKFDSELTDALNKPGSALGEVMSGASFGPDSIERYTVNNTYISFSGDLSFPSIENGDDAEDFINHLTSFTGE